MQLRNHNNMRIKHRSLLAITILTLITLGIYQPYWYFITKTEMNVVNAKSAKVPFFLWFFVPLVNIWWFWRFAKAIEKITHNSVSRWSAFFGPIFLSIAGTLLGIYASRPQSLSSTLAFSGVGYSLFVVVLGLLPIYYYQSNLNKYAK